jgi:hypothetical protein
MVQTVISVLVIRAVSVDVAQLARGEGDAHSELGRVNGAGCGRMVGQLFGDSFGDLGAEMPEERMPPGTKQAHEAVTDQDEAAELKESFGDEFLFHEIGPCGCGQ